MAEGLNPTHQEFVVNILRRAAQAEILPRFHNLSKSDVSIKKRADDLVTAADIAAEHMITRALHQRFPDALVMGEEAASADPTLLDKIADAPLAFIIDPVDGTWNFAHGFGMFGIILAVTQYGKPVMGVIYDPLADNWAVAQPDGPAQLISATGAIAPLKTAMGKPIEKLTGHLPLYMFTGDKRRRLAATLPSFYNVTSLRCSAHEYRMVAQGFSDFVLTESLWPWDHAAGALICQQAGAHVEMLDGGAYSAARHRGYLLVAPDRMTWNKLRKVFHFLLDLKDDPHGTNKG
ncbi:MAG: inositol monophosphatase [Pseudomonadota bacterium]